MYPNLQIRYAAGLCDFWFVNSPDMGPAFRLGHLCYGSQ